MILCRTRRHRRAAGGLLGLCLLSLALVCAGGCTSARRSGEPKPVVSNDRLQELLTQRYEILQRMVEDERRQLEAGRVDVATFQNLTDAMYRAQADLCPTTEERVRVYEKLVEFLTAQERLVEQQVEAGRALRVQVAQAKLVTLNARIDLERLRQGQSSPQP